MKKMKVITAMVLVFVMAFGLVVFAQRPVQAEEAAMPNINFTITGDGEYGDMLYLPEHVPVSMEDLLRGVTAVDENGQVVKVTVADIDGLDMENPLPRMDFADETMLAKPYIITYEAIHPITGEAFHVEREAYVTIGIMPLPDVVEPIVIDTPGYESITTLPHVLTEEEIASLIENGILEEDGTIPNDQQELVCPNRKEHPNRPCRGRTALCGGDWDAYLGE